jgi:hypothetical protein
MVFSGLAIEAVRKSCKHGGAWRLWQLARTIDQAGSGQITRAQLRDFLNSLEIDTRTQRRWLHDAAAIGFIRLPVFEGPAARVFLASAGAVGAILGCKDVGRRVRLEDARQLAGTDWRSHLWAACLTRHKERPISRRTLQQLTGAPARTQRYREAKAGVKREANYSRSDVPADHLTGIKEHGKHAGAFASRNGRVFWRLPNSYKNDRAQLANEGRRRKANSIISTTRSTRRLVKMGQSSSAIHQNGWQAIDLGQRGEGLKLFHDTEAGLRSAQRKLARQDGRRVNELYGRSGRANSGARMWEPAAC